MAPEDLGRRLRELRKQAGMTQRHVAEKAEIDFTYLSKIEGGLLVPREVVLVRLAAILNVGKDELITLAGKVPSDLADKLRNEELIKYLRSYPSREIVRRLKGDDDS